MLSQIIHILHFLSSKLVTPDFVVNWIEDRAARRQQIWKFIGVTTLFSDWMQRVMHKVDIVCRKDHHQQNLSTRSSADADKPRDAFTLSRLPNMVPFNGFLLVCYSNFVPKTKTKNQIFDSKKCRDLKIRVRGHSRSSDPTQIDPPHMISY